MRGIAFFFAAIAVPAFAQDGPPIGFFAGSYDIYGRLPNLGATYSGSAEITVDGDVLRIRRRTAEEATSETARMERHHVVEARVIYFYDDEAKRTAMCLWSVDLGNYAILNCVRRGPSDDVAAGLETFVSTQ